MYILFLNLISLLLYEIMIGLLDHASSLNILKFFISIISSRTTYCKDNGEFGSRWWWGVCYVIMRIGASLRFFMFIRVCKGLGGTACGFAFRKDWCLLLKKLNLNIYTFGLLGVELRRITQIIELVHLNNMPILILKNSQK